MKEFWKSVTIWRNCGREFCVQFFRRTLYAAEQPNECVSAQLMLIDEKNKRAERNQFWSAKRRYFSAVFARRSLMTSPDIAVTWFPLGVARCKSRGKPRTRKRAPRCPFCRLSVVSRDWRIVETAHDWCIVGLVEAADGLWQPVTFLPSDSRRGCPVLGERWISVRGHRSVYLSCLRCWWQLSRAFNCRILYSLYLPTVILNITWYSITL